MIEQSVLDSGVIWCYHYCYYMLSVVWIIVRKGNGSRRH